VRNPAYKGEGFALRYAANHTKKGVPDMRPKAEWLPLAPDTTPAIIDAETWTLAQKRLDTNRGEHARNIRHPMLLRGFVFCGVCGKKMAVQPPHERSPRYRFRCTSRSNDLGETWCGGASMVAEDVERDVWEKVSKLVLDPRLIARGVEKRKGGTDNKDHERRRAAIRAEMARIEAQQKRFLDHFGEDDPDFPWELMRERVADLQRRRARLVDDLAALDAVTPETVPDNGCAAHPARMVRAGGGESAAADAGTEAGDPGCIRDQGDGKRRAVAGVERAAGAGVMSAS
jgi:hypothetical protein